MKNGLIFFIGILVSISTLQAKPTSWKISKSAIKYVFVPSKSTEETELIRLYQDKSFEHLVYVPVRKYNKGQEVLAEVHESTVKRNSGTYSIAAGKIQFKVSDKEFSSDLYKKEFAFIDNKVYTSRFQSMFNKKNFLLKTVNKSKYAFPFYLDPLSQLIVRNEDAAAKIELADLAKWITKGGHSQWNNYQSIVEFVHKQTDLDNEASIDLQHESSDDLRTKLAGENRKVNRLELAELIAQLGNKAGLNVRSIRGYKKQKEGKNFVRIAHAWNQINLGEQALLSDASMDEKWLKVDPSVMIHSHLPLKEEDQLLEKSITSEQFDQLAYVEQVKESTSYISFLPTKQQLVAKGKVAILFDQHISGVKVTFTAFDEVNNRFGTPQLVTNVTNEQVGAKTLVSVPISAKKGQLSVQLPNGMVVHYFIENNGSEEVEVAEYLKGIVKSRPTLPLIKTLNANALVSTTSTSSKSVIESWGSSTDKFLNELAELEFSDASLLQHPLIQEARKYFGVKEIEGEQDNKTIMTFFKETGNGSIKSDEEAWCSVFVGYCAKNAGFSYSKKATAKSWLEQGTATSNPKPGDIVVFWREDPDSWKGHVAIYLGKDETTNEIICLGGNQDDQVCIRQYGSNHVVGFRTLTKK